MCVCVLEEVRIGFVDEGERVECVEHLILFVFCLLLVVWFLFGLVFGWIDLSVLDGCSAVHSATASLVPVKVCCALGIFGPMLRYAVMLFDSRVARSCRDSQRFLGLFVKPYCTVVSELFWNSI